MYRIVLFFLLVFKLLLLWIVQEDVLFLHPQVDGKGYQLWAEQISSGQWFRSEPFYQAPLYPYCLALSYTFFGTAVPFTALWQILFSTATAFLLFSFTRKIYGSRSAYWSLALFALSGMIYFYELQPLKTTLTLFFTMLVLRLFLEPPNVWLGISAGLLILLRENTLLLIPVLVGYSWRYQKWTKRDLLQVLIGLFLPLSLTLFHNYQACGEWILTTYQGGTNFYIGNHPKASGTYQPLLSARQTPEYEGKDAVELARRLSGKDLSYNQVSRFWFLKGLSFFWESPWQALLLQGKKLCFYFWPAEFPDGLQYTFWRARYPVYYGLVIGYGTLWLLGIAGVVYSVRSYPETRFLVFFLVINIISVVPFFIFSRYRLPVVLGLYPLAGYALAHLPWRYGMMLLLLGSSLEFLPANQSNSSFILGVVEYQQGNWELSEKALRVAVEEGDIPEAWSQLGDLYQNQKDFYQAQGCYEKAISLNPRFSSPYFGLGSVSLIRSSPSAPTIEKADSFFKKAQEVSPLPGRICREAGRLYWRLGEKISSPMNLLYLKNAYLWMGQAVALEKTLAPKEDLAKIEQLIRMTESK